jgi:ubiquinone/menaquinone biosynthesis C-methylase UbiE
MMNVLDVGCGQKKRPGAIGIDCNPRTAADVLHDLNVFPYPFRDNEFQEIHCDSILEHLDDFFRVMSELYRIACPGGVIHIKVPYYTSFDAYTDPSHKHFFTSRSFDYFRENYAYNYYTPTRFTIVARHLTFLRLKQLGNRSPYQMIGIEYLANTFMRVYEAFFAYIFPAHILSFTLRVMK